MATFLSRDVVELTLRLTESLSCPRALTVAILVRYEEWDQLARLQCDPQVYLDPEDYAKSSAASSFLRKLEDLPTTIDRRLAAYDNWRKGEQGCYLANERLSPYLPENFAFSDREDHVEDLLVLARKKIASWLGFAPRVLTDGRFGPGGTYADKGVYTTIPDKMSSLPTLTREALWFLPQWLGTAWGKHCAAHSRDPVFVKGNRFATAPKDATKLRAIACEPSVNIFYQLGLGTQIRGALRRLGVDLDNGQVTHVQVAREASIRGHLATLDLTNASDSLCRVLVRLLLPHAWYFALDAIRSPKTLVDGKWVVLEKFSSMGNGYTFELESLIFLALASAAMDLSGVKHQIGKTLLVYGDDIIIPTEAYASVVAVLNHCGFRLNETKSFHQGPFRESCGGDFFSGLAVRPHFLKESPSAPEHFITVANGLRRLERDLRVHSPGVSLRRAWLYCLDQLPKNVRDCRGPEDLGDLCIHTDDWARRAKWRSNGIRYVRVWRPHKHRKVPYGNFHPEVVLACATYGLGWGDGGVTPRDSVLSYKVGWVPFS